MMTADTDNPLFGRTLNPNNPSLTAGGSTGGEGALIALRGSLLGAGTDMVSSQHQVEHHSLERLLREGLELQVQFYLV
jgi:Asp-tRNA(Asn)/Glu-tRNA(Gln) amidotransferase A subunit family amidase